MGIQTLMLSRDGRNFDVKGTWLLYLGSNHCGRAEMCDCDVCWLPRCHPVACHLSKTLSCPSRGFASHLPVARYHQSSSRSVVPKKSDGCPPAFSEVKARKLFVVRWGRIVFVCQYCATLTHLPSLFSQWSRASSQRLFSCPSVPYRDSV